MDLPTRLRLWGQGLWKPARDQAVDAREQGTRDEPLEAAVRRLIDEREIERTYRRCHNCYDAHDLDGVLECFTDDVVQVNGRGTFVGKDALRRSYEYLISGQRMIFHYGIGVFVTVDDEDPDAGLLTARYFGYMTPVDSEPNFHVGTYVNWMRRMDGRWLIAEQRITFNYQVNVELAPRSHHPNQPDPDLVFSHVHLVEDRYLQARRECVKV